VERKAMERVKRTLEMGQDQGMIRLIAIDRRQEGEVTRSITAAG